MPLIPMFTTSEPDQGLMDEGSWAFCGLNRTQRFYAFGGCIIFGFILSLLSTLTLITGNTTGFAILYSIGNIIAMLSTTFIIGIVKQFKTMFAPGKSLRLWAAVIFWALLVLTLVLAFLLHNFVLCIVLVVVQFAAFTWYAASYIPYGRDIIRKFFGSCVQI